MSDETRALTREEMHDKAVDELNEAFEFQVLEAKRWEGEYRKAMRLLGAMRNAVEAITKEEGGS